MVNDANMANSDSDKTPLFLIPGWGTDWRLWKHQLEADLGPVEPIVPKWLEPEPRELLSNYAARLAKSIDPGRPCYLVGLSFGGMIAVEMAQHLDVKACVLIASIPSGDRLPRRYHIFSPFDSLDSFCLLVFTSWCGSFASRFMQAKDIGKPAYCL